VIGTEMASREREQIVRCAEVVGLPLETFAGQGVVLTGNPDDLAAAGALGFYAIAVAHVSPEDVLKAHGAHEVYRHVAHLSLLLRQH